MISIKETALASFRVKVEEMCLSMVGEMKEKYKPQKDNLNDQVADIAYGAAQSYN